MQYAVQVISNWVQKNNCEISVLEKHLLNIYETILHRMVKEIPSHYKSIDPKDIKSTYTDEYIVCLEDGRQLKMLKRHLRSKYNMSIVEYKNKWGLPQDYPVVAKNYALKRSLIAQKIRSNSK
ncbi:MAG: MucR family transcriptional regulator [Alphaproteobacteria bacterium]|nr:MucR family transcriptional regulator [Rickettsiales bacterium]